MAVSCADVCICMNIQDVYVHTGCATAHCAVSKCGRYIYTGAVVILLIRLCIHAVEYMQTLDSQPEAQGDRERR